MKTTNSKWSAETKQLAKELHSKLTISNENWHRYKVDHKRRAAELIGAAIVQLLNDGEESDIEEIMNQSMLWLKKELKDPGCPNH